MINQLAEKAHKEFSAMLEKAGFPEEIGPIVTAACAKTGVDVKEFCAYMHVVYWDICASVE